MRERTVARTMKSCFMQMNSRRLRSNRPRPRRPVLQTASCAMLRGHVCGGSDNGGGMRPMACQAAIRMYGISNGRGTEPASW